MKLNDAVIQSMKLDGVEYSTIRELVSKLEKAKRLSMSVYVNTKLVCSSQVLLRSDNNWLIASTNCLVSFTKSVHVESIVVRIKQDDVVLFESNTVNCNTIIPANDSLASFHVCLVNDSPYNDLEKRVPESTFTPMEVDRIPDTNFEDITSQINDVTNVTVDGDDNKPGIEENQDQQNTENDTNADQEQEDNKMSTEDNSNSNKEL